MKSAPTPEGRIIALFSILDDWLDAPGMRPQLQSGELSAADHRQLNALLLSLVSAGKLREPEKLAFQLYFILLGALNEELRNPGSDAMARAGEAAAQLVAAARIPVMTRSRAYAVAATVLVSLISGALLFSLPERTQPAQPVVFAQTLPVANVARVVARPDQLVALYQMHDKMRSAQCSYPQALMLAADQRAVFLDGVVNIDRLDTAATNLDKVSQLYQKVDCYYPPAAMLL